MNYLSERHSGSKSSILLYYFVFCGTQLTGLKDLLDRYLLVQTLEHL